MLHTKDQDQNLPYLQQENSTTALINSVDWGKTTLGNPHQWSLVLQLTIANLLSNNLPTLLCWGKELIQLYNASYQDILGASQLTIGENLAKVDQEAWQLMRPVFEKVWQGESITQTGVHFPFIQHATASRGYYDLNYSPISDEKGNIEGIAVVLIENHHLAPSVTPLTYSEQLINSNELLSEREQQIISLVESAPFPIGVYVGKEMKITRANQSIKDIWGKGNDIVGKNYADVLPELDPQIYQQLDDVYETGIAFHTKHQLVPLQIEGELKEFYFNYSFTPLRNKAGQVYGVMNTAAEVTDLVLAKQKVERSKENFYNILYQSPVAMCLLQGSQFVVEMANTAMLTIWGQTNEQTLGKPIFELLPEAKEQGLEQVMTAVFETGKPFYAHEQPVVLQRHGHTDTIYQNFVYQPYRDFDGHILGVIAISTDVTEQVVARRELENAYEQLRLSKDAAKLGTFDMDILKGTMEWDKRCRLLFGIHHMDEVTYEKDFLQGLHPDDRARVIQHIDELFAGKISQDRYDIEYRTVDAVDQQIRWIRAKGKVYFNELNQLVRFIGSVLDITENKLNELKQYEYAEKQGHLAAIVNSSDDIIISKTLEGIITSWNTTAEKIFGYQASEAIGQHISLVIPADRLSEEEFIISQIKSHKKVHHFETVRQSKSGHPLHLSITVSPILDEKGNIIGASKIARDISVQHELQETAKRYTERLEIMNMVIGAVSEELDLNKILQKVTDATTDLTGAKFGAFFYNTTDELGESYTLYTLSGAPKEAFDKFEMPRNTAVFHPTFSGTGVVRSDDITKDPRYGKSEPYYGIPKEHLPVVSYLAVPVISRSGQVIGGLFFTHPERAKFTKAHESIVQSIAAQAAIGLDNAKLFEEVKALNDKKDEFISLASHELKTPLTCISGYIQIVSRLQTDLQSKKFLGKAVQQVNRLTALVNDLLDISKIEAGKLQLVVGKFDLRHVIEEAIELIGHTSTDYTITFDAPEKACIIDGDGQRIEQVVINLLTNAIKYSPGAKLVEVHLRCEDSEIVVGIKDYGRGIGAKQLKNVFARFYRVDEQNSNISGLGIGLYLAHEIVTRHNGKIWVESEVNVGSTFYFSLPR